MSVNRNLELAFALIRQAAADEEFGKELTEAGSDAPLLLLPADDPDLARANEEVALILASRGEPFEVRHVSRSLVPRSTAK